MSGKKNNLIVLAIILLGLIAFFALASLARADGGFRNGQKIFAIRATTAFFNACNVVTNSGSDYRGHQFTARKGEELTVTANAAGEFRMWCSRHNAWAIRVVNGHDTVGWVYEGNLSPSKPATAVEKANAVGGSVEDAFYSTANRAFALLNSNFFYWKSPYGVWGLLRWDGVSDPRPYWK